MLDPVTGGPAVGAVTSTSAEPTEKLNSADANQCVHVNLRNMFLILQDSSLKTAGGWYSQLKMITVLISGPEQAWDLWDI
jgi:hypothetical protein